MFAFISGHPIKKSLFDSVALQEYILLCCQKPNGGLIDKPGKPQDLYHTCYTLSGVSIAQHCESSLCPLVLGDPCNELLPTHPLFNVPPQSVMESLQYFAEINLRTSSVDRSTRSESADSTTKSKNGEETVYESEDNTEDNSTTTPSSVSSY